jgi:tRNA A37 threonylcarbamoyladenosine dehydratase
MTEVPDLARRFSGVRRLYGDAGLSKLQAAHVIVIGIGGVGSWAAEALARNAIGEITLIDLDNIAESNVNRQIHALDGNMGKAKVSAMHERIVQINPTCRVWEVEDFITPSNLDILLKPCDVVLDCTDDAKAKIALAHFCKMNKIPLIMSGSAGGRLDPTRIRLSDIASVTGDKLLAKVRNQLRRDHGFPKVSNAKKPAKFGLMCAYSDEPVIKPDAVCETDETTMTGLHCAGYGSSVSITATFGFVLAQQAINHLLTPTC